MPEKSENKLKSYKEGIVWTTLVGFIVIGLGIGFLTHVYPGWIVAGAGVGLVGAAIMRRTVL